MPEVRILVTGSRGWDDSNLTANTFARGLSWWRQTSGIEVPFGVTVVHGGAKGADLLADIFAKVCGWTPEVHAAQWGRKDDGTYNAGAGLERNAYMVGLGADLCLCFAGACAKFSHQDQPPHVSHGAQHCATLAQAAGIPVFTRYPNGASKWGAP